MFKSFNMFFFYLLHTVICRTNKDVELVCALRQANVMLQDINIST